MGTFISSHNTAFCRKIRCVAMYIRNLSSRFLHDQHSCRKVPGRKLQFKEHTAATAGRITEIQRSRTTSADIQGMIHNIQRNTKRFISKFPVIRRRTESHQGMFQTVFADMDTFSIVICTLSCTGFKEILCERIVHCSPEQLSLDRKSVV